MGLHSQFMSTRTELIYAFLSLVSQLIAAFVLGLATLPAFIFVRWSLTSLVSSMNNLGGALLFCLSLGLAFVIFGNTLLLLIIMVRSAFRIRSLERRGQLFSLAALGSVLFNLLLQLAALFYLPLCAAASSSCGFIAAWAQRSAPAR